MLSHVRTLSLVLTLALAGFPAVTRAQQAGTPLMWGAASYGHLGDAPEIARVTPVPVVGPTNLRSIASGFRHTVARRIDGTVWTWGDNEFGQLGNGPLPTMTSTPAQVANAEGISSVSASYMHTLALRSDGTVLAWGWNANGEVGDGTTLNRFVPVAVSGLAGVVAVSAGTVHSLAVTAGGGVWAWGGNSRGQLGDGTTTQHELPAQVVGVPAAAAVAAGSRHSLALATDGTVWAWGNNEYGQLGDATTTERLTPVKVPGLTGVTEIAAGYFHSLALKADGTVWAWGRNADGGMAGSGVMQNELSPVQVVGLTGITAISGGGYHSLARRSDGTVWAWGRSGSGECGRATQWAQPLADVVTGVANAIAVAAGNGVSLAALADGTTVTWGATAGAAGDGLRLYSASPAVVPGAPAVRSLAFGANATLAIASDGSLWSWGGNTTGLLGTGTSGPFTQAPTQVMGLTGVVAVAIGFEHALALDAGGRVWSWGGNRNGQLGDDSRPDISPSPAFVPGLDDVAAIAAGWDVSLAVREDGSVWSWGSGRDGTLGDGTTNRRSTPAPIAGLPAIQAVAAQVWGYHCLALARDGTVWGWGRNSSGRIGDGTNVDRFTPVQVQGLSGVVAIVLTTWGTSYALDASGHVWSWGAAVHGQLGDGSTSDRWLPAMIPGPENVVELAAGDTHAIVRTASGQVLTWGRNFVGELGLGDTDDRWLPAPVPGLSGVQHVFAGTDLSGVTASCELDCTTTVSEIGQPGIAEPFVVWVTNTSGCVAEPTFDWDFGDGSPHSSEQSASHTYAAEGTFHWVVVVSSGDQTCRKEGDITITAPCSVTCSAVVPAYIQAGALADFESSSTLTSCAGGAVADWSFGDGRSQSPSLNATHAYSTPGTYTWTLIVSSGDASCTRTGQITVQGAACSGPYALVIPAAAHSNNQWQSDLDFYNVGATAASVDIALLKPGQANLSPSAMNVAVPPGLSVRIPDILGAQLPAANAALGIRFCSGSPLVNSRFYNIGTARSGTFGTIVPALPPSAAVTPTTRGVFHHLAYSPSPSTGYRVNLGFANASPFSVSVTVRLYGDDGALIGTKTLSVRAFEQSRLDRIHQTLGTGPVTHGAMTVEVNTANARLHAYALLIDNISGDPAFMGAELVPR